MTDDPTRPSATEDGEQRLRKVLGTVDDLEPPQDDLFVPRALLRGRARTSRRRTSVLGAAAAVVLVGAAGGTWLVQQQRGDLSSTASAGVAAEERVMSGDGSTGAATGGDSAGGAAPSVAPPAAPSMLPSGLPSGLPTTAVPPRAPGVPPARDGSAWFSGAVTPQRTAFATVEERLETDFAAVFAGAYSAPDGNGRIVVTETSHDPALESLVRGAMPAADDVSFVVVANSYAAQRALADRVVADAGMWRAQGVDITGVRLDGPTNRVVVSADEGAEPGVLVQHYGGDVLTVAAGSEVGKRPDGTPATLQR
jgi:hypothetical protein